MHLALCLVPSGFPRCYFSRPLPCSVCISKYVAYLLGVSPARHPWSWNDKALCLQRTQGSTGLAHHQGSRPPWKSALTAFPQHPRSASLVSRHSPSSLTLGIGTWPLCPSHETTSAPALRLGNCTFHFCPLHNPQCDTWYWRCWYRVIKWDWGQNWTAVFIGF